jgi:agmatinase
MAHRFRSFIDVPSPPPTLAPGDLVVFGAGHGTPYPAETELGYDVATASVTAPQAIRDGATQSSSNIDHHDFDLDGPLLGDGRRRLYDAGDLMLSATDGPGNRAVIEAATRAILSKGGVPVLLGGDDSVPVPFLAGFDQRPVDILQIDAHIDWRDTVGGEKWGYSSTMRRASERAVVRSITQVGMRGVGSARPEEVQTALAWGARLITVDAARQMGGAGVAALIPEGGRLVVQIDLDALDPSVCGAVNAVTPGGFGFGELAAILRHVIGERGLAGLSVVELVPHRDLHGLSAIAAARLICNAIGAAVRH